MAIANNVLHKQEKMCIVRENNHIERKNQRDADRNFLSAALKLEKITD